VTTTSTDVPLLRKYMTPKITTSETFCPKFETFFRKSIRVPISFRVPITHHTQCSTCRTCPTRASSTRSPFVRSVHHHLGPCLPHERRNFKCRHITGAMARSGILGGRRPTRTLCARITSHPLPRPPQYTLKMPLNAGAHSEIFSLEMSKTQALMLDSLLRAARWCCLLLDSHAG
jgi:hypothetical protein